MNARMISFIVFSYPALIEGIRARALERVPSVVCVCVWVYACVCARGCKQYRFFSHWTSLSRHISLLSYLI